MRLAHRATCSYGYLYTRMLLAFYCKLLEVFSANNSIPAENSYLKVGIEKVGHNAMMSVRVLLMCCGIVHIRLNGLPLLFLISYGGVLKLLQNQTCIHQLVLQLL